MGWRFLSRASVAVLVSVALMPAVACASEGLVRPVAGERVLGFGAGYASGGTQRTHHGVDLRADVGGSALAAAGGVVTFAGAVPADGGGRTTAVSVQTPGGLLVTVMPLDRSLVRTGDVVSPGDRVGVIAKDGDASSAETHVHLSVRDNGEYIDPEPLLESGTAPEAPGVGGAHAAETGGSSVSAQTGSSSSPTQSTPGGRVASVSGAASAVVGYRVASAPSLAPHHATALRQAFSAEIARLRAGRGRLSATGFGEPTLADRIRAVVPRAGAPIPMPVVGAGVLAAAVAGLGLAVGLRRGPAPAHVLRRTH